MNGVAFYGVERVLWRKRMSNKSSSLPCTNDLKIIMDSDHLFIHLCVCIAL